MAIKKTKKVKGPEVDFTNPAKIIEDVELGNHLEKSFLEYAYLVILQRALPDARDGLIPSKRRILYTMNRLNLHHTAKHVKSARVVGEVMGIFHPHGSSYGTLVGMAQDFNMRVPLIDGHGNFGSVEDGPAADRYTEARLARAASFMLEEIKEDGVDMKPNYDGTTEEPTVLPAQFPNLLVNGSQGIAVGMANKMPPHNPKEVIDATRWLLKHPDATLDKLMTFVPAPDFPSAGIIIGTDGIKQAYETGRGKLIIRARHHIEPLARGKNRIVFTEMPYEVGVETVVEKIQEGIEASKIVGIADAIDLTDKDNGIMFVVETKAGINPEVLVESLFKNTPLELAYNINNTVITPDDSPAELGLKELLQIFIDFRIETVVRRTKSRLKKRKHRLHQIEALMQVLLDIVKAVELIRGSANPDAARTALMKHFGIDEEQADYVMNMQLRRLTKFDRLELENEKAKLSKEVIELDELLANRPSLINLIDKELKEVSQILDVERKSEVMGMDLTQHIQESKKAAATVSVEVADEPCVISLSHKGAIVRSKTAAKGALSTIATTTRGKFVLITSKGNAYRIDALHVGEKAASVASVLPSPLPKGEKAIALAKAGDNDSKAVSGLAMGTARGVVKLQPQNWPKTQDEFSVISLQDGDEIIGARWLDDVSTASYVFVSSDSSALRFEASKVRGQLALSSAGMAGIKLADDAEAIAFAAITADEMDNAVVVTHTGLSGKVSKLALFNIKGRSTAGMRSQRFVKGEDKLVFAAVGVNPSLTSTEGKAIELPVIDPRRDGAGKPFEGGIPTR